MAHRGHQGQMLCSVNISSWGPGLDHFLVLLYRQYRHSLTRSEGKADLLGH